MLRTHSGVVTILWAAAFSCCALADASFAVAQSTTAAEASRWIAELGDDNYSVRAAAADQLANGGSVARAALAKVANSPDPEIRSAARRLITLIDDSDFNRRLAEFAADVDGKRGLTLPGWNEFSELVGRDAAARGLFVDMQREDSSLLERRFHVPAADQQIDWEGKVAQLLQMRMFNQPGEFAAPLGSCATLLFLGSLDDAELSDSAARSLVQLTQIPPVSEALTPGQARSAIRRLVAAWIVHCPNRSESVVEQRLAIMLQQQLSEALPFALEIIQRDPKYLTLSPSRQVMAILAVGKFGSEENVSALEPLLDDHTDPMPRQPMNGLANGAASVQVRDVALAVMLHLTGQEPMTYGFLQARPHPQIVFDLSSLSMKDDAQREAAAQKWRAWRAQHKLNADRPASS